MWILRRVVGTSMLPSLKQGDVVVGQRGKQPRVGDIVIAWVHDKEVIKRISQVTNEGYELLGDNKAVSTDSRTYGFVERQHIRGVVIKTIKSRAK